MTQPTTTTCPECNGSGKTWYSCCGDNMDDYPEHSDYMICPTCQEGLGEEEPCETCKGSGEVTAD